MDYASIPRFHSVDGGLNISIPQQQWKDEYEFNAGMFPVFVSLFGTLLVNCEYLPWLEVNENKRNDLKPDWFLLSIPDLISTGAIPIKYPTESVYGTPKDNCSFLVDIILEGKLGDGPISPTDLGKLFQYLFVMVENGNSSPRGIVYNSHEFVFAKLNDQSELVAISSCSWDTPGSKGHLMDTLQIDDCNPTLGLLKKLTTTKGLRIIKALGRGRFGCVFEVMLDEEVFALKIVPNDPDSVKTEFTRLLSLAKQYPGIVVDVVDDSITQDGEATAYLMKEVGFYLEIPSRSIFMHLCKLHVHNEQHGDPRIANIIMLEDRSLRWIDFRPVVQSSPVRDVEILIESWVGAEALKNEKVMMKLRSYSGNISEDNMTAIYEEVKKFAK